MIIVSLCLICACIARTQPICLQQFMHLLCSQAAALLSAFWFVRQSKRSWAQCLISQQRVVFRQNFKAIIDNLCPECKSGDLDFRQAAGGPGDGRWDLEWKIIPCPSTGGLTVTRESGNKYYSKLKVEGGPSPVTSMKCDGITGKRTSDAFFEFQDKSGTFCAGVSCTVAFSSGGSDSLNISKQQLGSFC